MKKFLAEAIDAEAASKSTMTILRICSPEVISRTGEEKTANQMRRGMMLGRAVTLDRHLGGGAMPGIESAAR
jgi:hypothetical protein